VCKHEEDSVIVFSRKQSRESCTQR